MKISVEWHPKAYEDLAEIYLKSDSEERGRIQRAIHEIDELLRVNPGSKGKQIFAGQLPPGVLDKLFDRMSFIPEIVRQIRVGPMEAVFTDHEEDGRVNLWFIKLRA